MKDYILNELEKIPKNKTSYYSIAQYLLKAEDITRVSIKELIDNCYVSVSTPTRLAKYLGYEGFKELKYEIKLAKKYEAKAKKEFLASGEYFLKLNESLNITFEHVDNELIQTIAKLIYRSARVNIFAIADTSLVALDFTYKLERLNKNVNCYSDYHLQQVYANLSELEDLCIGISYSGSTQEVLNNLKLCKERGAKTILITSRNITKNYVDYVINISPSEQMSRKYSMISRITILSILDLIYLKYIEITKDDSERNFKITKIEK
ncbi:MAG: MurR/RpiR family transcriptional regulator [Mycoplasmatales bacterium]